MNISLSLKSVKDLKILISIGVLWLVHVSGMIGVSMGYTDFFLPKTPLNLSLAFMLLVWVFPINSLKHILLSFTFFAVGMLVEWIGVQYGFLFGEYYYGNNLGPKLDGVPWLIGVNWAVLVIITGAIANHLLKSKFKRILLGAGLMVVLDFFMEASAPVFDFWVFSEGIAPFQNYLAWFLIAAFLHFLFQEFKMNGSYLFSKHLYACQLIFFAWFYIYNTYL